MKRDQARTSASEMGSNASADNAGSAGSRAGRRLVLLVEDNEADALLVEEAIERYRLPVDLEVIGDGAKAFEFIQRLEVDEEAACPAVLLLDLNLPMRGGKEVLRRARESRRLRHIPVVIISSSESAAERQELEELGANRYFRKPSGYDAFLTVGELIKAALSEAPIGPG